MNHKTLSLEVQFEIELLKRYLKNHSHPEQEAHRLPAFLTKNVLGAVTLDC